jgi:hypothetical protein
MRHRLGWVSGLLVVALVGFPVGALANAQPIDRDDFRADMRKLWEDHIGWTRLFIVETLGGLPGKDATAQRLLKNQDDIGNAIKPFYGDEAGTKLAALLREHILIAADLVGAAKAGDTAKQDDATKRWFANADEIAGFLSGANPKNWPPDATKTMMHDHLKLTTEEAVAQLKGDFAASIAAYDKVHAQILHMADALADGIVAQHPQHFKG